MTQVIETQTPACGKLYRLVRDFVNQTPSWGDAIRYQSKPDERLDLTLASLRVYGRPTEFLVIAAAAGRESVENQMDEQLLVLPNEDQLAAIKERAGYVNDPLQRT